MQDLAISFFVVSVPNFARTARVAVRVFLGYLALILDQPVNVSSKLRQPW